MKVVLEIIRYFLAALLALAILIIYLSNIALSTVLSEGYVISKLEDTNYYKKVYEAFNENVSKYIMQSGLDEIQIEDICSTEKVEQDTIYILENMYLGKTNEIETDSIKTNLNNKIDEYLGGKEITVESRESIEKFEDIICKEYVDTIMHTSYEAKVNNYIIQIQNIVKTINQYGKYCIMAVIVFIFVVDIKKPSRNISICGMSLLFLGVVFIYTRYEVLKNIEIGNLYLLSDAFSDVLKKIANENLDILLSNAKKVIVFGVILIIIGNALQIKIKLKKKHNENKRTLYLSDSSR